MDPKLPAGSIEYFTSSKIDLSLLITIGSTGVCKFHANESKSPSSPAPVVFQYRSTVAPVGTLVFKYTSITSASSSKSIFFVIYLASSDPPTPLVSAR